MTSSLVGSEMCIRDSPSLLRATAAESSEDDAPLVPLRLRRRLHRPACSSGRLSATPPPRG
eukprot:8173320-Prorocentrum_lima.AAC.1